jgi:hypothetical protein
VDVTKKYTRESFSGFDMNDDEVGPGECRSLAIELKRLIEAMAADAHEQNDEIFFSRDLEHALRRFLIDPTKPALRIRPRRVPFRPGIRHGSRDSIPLRDGRSLRKSVYRSRADLPQDAFDFASEVPLVGSDFL